jgi:hypothetical protein
MLCLPEDYALIKSRSQQRVPIGNEFRYNRIGLISREGQNAESFEIR